VKFLTGNLLPPSAWGNPESKVCCVGRLFFCLFLKERFVLSDEFRHIPEGGPHWVGVMGTN
jgi:hypothetical protein